MRCFHLFHERWSRLSVLSVAAGALATVASMAAPSYAGTITFGSGVGNTFDMEFVTIGNPNNAADTKGSPSSAGAVGYEYGIGKFEVSEDMIEKYNANFGTANNLVITKDTRGTAKPATSVSWNEAARFVNWLNTSTGNQAAYKFTTSGVNDNIALWTSGDAGYDVNNKYRNSLAKYFLPSYNEWYKAAYYKPTNSTYYNFANGSDTAPTPVASGTGAGTAVYEQSFDQGPADVMLAGGLSPYGVMGLGGNVFEWEESSEDLANSSGFSLRGFRGGFWDYSSNDLSSWTRNSDYPSNVYDSLGFRVASLSSSAPPAVPEPSMMVIGTLFGLGGLMAKRRMKK
ncbi:MAG: SUMF1/EgtB/PvdO family nonheme iron enzyme [Planctomycetaceae bacterium]|jgi:formylglycine-generating enzyme required for sulfatase activity|nr:SUMF1/EgtB/PvdO family nonheme iron enzyme [Planctomycetaceae bacterium]